MQQKPENERFLTPMDDVPVADRVAVIGRSTSPLGQLAAQLASFLAGAKVAGPA
jgi:hypothetical protein